MIVKQWRMMSAKWNANPGSSRLPGKIRLTAFTARYGCETTIPPIVMLLPASGWKRGRPSARATPAVC